MTAARFSYMPCPPLDQELAVLMRFALLFNVLNYVNLLFPGNGGPKHAP